MKKSKTYACWFEGKEDKAVFFNNWDACAKHVKGVSQIQYRGFSDKTTALNYLNQFNQKKSSSFSSKVNFSSNLHIYVDGSYQHPCLYAGWAWVATINDTSDQIHDNTHIIKAESGVSKTIAASRNIDGEIISTLKALTWFSKNYKNDIQLFLYHDYTGIAKWALGEWKAKIPLTKDYYSLMQKYLNQYTINFIKVPSHSGNSWNDYVDKQAKEALNNFIQTNQY